MHANTHVHVHDHVFLLTFRAEFRPRWWLFRWRSKPVVRLLGYYTPKRILRLSRSFYLWQIVGSLYSTFLYCVMPWKGAVAVFAWFPRWRSVKHIQTTDAVRLSLLTSKHYSDEISAKQINGVLLRSWQTSSWDIQIWLANTNVLNNNYTCIYWHRALWGKWKHRNCFVPPTVWADNGWKWKANIIGQNKPEMDVSCIANSVA
jgi:hypothetical protein